MTALLNRPAVCPVLIGRMDHLTVLRGLLEQSSSGAGQVILIGGEAGVGKTRLVIETARRAVEMDFQVLHGASFQADGASPYAPLLDMLRRHFAGWPPASVVAALGPSAPIIVPLMPDMLPPSGAALHYRQRLL